LWRDNLCDRETVVDDQRAVVEREMKALTEAIRQRDRAMAHLTRLLKWYEEETDSVTTPDPDIRSALRREVLH
jgi:hypothetical protein